MDYGAISLSISEITQAPNDMFLNRTILTGAWNQDKQCSGAATREIGEPLHAGNLGGHSIWWQWTTPFSSLATVRVANATYDTLLAAYTGQNLGNLTPVASNDDRATGDARSSISFQATANAIYQIALDGKNSPSHPNGDSGVAQVIFEQYPALSIRNFLIDSNIVCFGDGSSSITASVTVANSGTAGSGTLRLRVLAEPTYGNPAPEQALATFPVTPSTLSAGQSNTFSISGLVAAPTNNGSGFWNYGVALEENFADTWNLQHVWSPMNYNLSDCSPTTGAITDGGPPSLSAGTIGGVWTPVTLSNIVINLTNTAPDEGSSEYLSATARFSNGNIQTFNSTTWTDFPSTLASISTNGFMQLGPINQEQDQILTITAPYLYQGALGGVSTNITVRHLPPPSITNTVVQPGPVVRFTIRGVPNRRHVIQSSTNLLQWTSITSQSLGTNGLLQYVNSNPGPARQQFYRAMELP